MILENLSLVGRGLLWQSTILAGIVFCVLYLLPREQISARYRVALSGLFGAVFLLALPFLPAMSFGLDFTPVVFQAANDVMSISAPLDTLPPTDPLSAIAATSNVKPTSFAQFPIGLVLVLTWLAGSCLALSRLGFAARQGRGLLHGISPVHLENPSILSRKVTIIRSPGIKAPMVLGLIKPTIIVPVNFSLDFKNPETRIILEHEIAHIIRGDLWVNFAQRVILALLWWCLPLYWINRQIGAERENLCDAIATAKIHETSPSTENPARILAGVLVRFAEQRSQMPTPTLAIGIHPQAKLLARRIQRLCDGNPVPRLSKKSLISTSLAVPATLFMLSVMTPRAIADNPPDTKPITNTPVIASPNTIIENTPLRTRPIPIVQGRLTSKYGAVRKRFGSKIHTGVDIANIPGTPIYAPADARVLEATDMYKNSANWGKVVVIETKGGIQTVFAHLKDYNITAGQSILAGTQIGQVGNTGASTGPHVHLETLIDGKHVDPLTIWPELPH